MDGAADSVLRTVRVGIEPRDLAWNPAENRIYVANHGSSSISVLRDSGGGVAETMNDERGTMNRSPTVVRGVLFLPEAVGGERLAVGAHLLDISGRKVLELRPGANDVSRLAPGVYFVRSERSAVGREPSAVGCQKVIVTR
jgi:hypothetical protein